MYETITAVLAGTLCVGFLAQIKLVYEMAKILYSSGETERLERVMRRRASTQSVIEDEAPPASASAPAPRSVWTRVDN